MKFYTGFLSSILFGFLFTKTIPFCNCFSFNMQFSHKLWQPAFGISANNVVMIADYSDCVNQDSGFFGCDSQAIGEDLRVEPGWLEEE